MSRTAFLFPGQGSQVSGMGKDLAADFPEIAGPLFDEADRVLGLPLSQLCFEGSSEELLDTSTAQPAIYLTSLAAARILQAGGIHPLAVAGHSLGEYTALVVAGVLEWRDALRLVRRRGELMAAVNERTPGGMAAIIGLSESAVEAICADAAHRSGHTVEIANLNAPQQIVISGAEEALSVASALAGQAGAQHVVRLRAGAPFHSSFMIAVEDEFTKELSSVPFRSPQIPIIANVTAAPVRSGDEAKELLRRQLSGAVRWSQTLDLLAESEMEALLEVGPGRVLTNLNRGCHPGIMALAAGTTRQIGTALERIGKGSADLHPRVTVGGEGS